jgi:hypothetical protein
VIILEEMLHVVLTVYYAKYSTECE